MSGLWLCALGLVAILAGPSHALLKDTYINQLYSTVIGATRRAGDLIVLEDGSTLVFRGTAGKGGAIWNRYVQTGVHDDGPLDRMTIPNGCLTVDSLNYCDRHYRSEVLDFWPSDDIDTVRLGFYRNGNEVAFAEFNGTGSTARNWMSRARLLSSSWATLKTQGGNVFSIEGDSTNNTRWRRFFANRYYHNNCTSDRGWFAVLDRYDACPWTTGRHPYPAFLFSRRTNDHAAWSNPAEVETADVLAVTVRFRSSPVFRPSA